MLTQHEISTKLTPMSMLQSLQRFQTLLLSLALNILSLVYKRKHHFPPSPIKLPIVGNLHQIGPLPHRSLHALSKKHGPLMFLYLGRIPTLIVSSADAAREIMTTHDDIFSNRPSLKVPSQLLYGCRDIAFAPHGEYWRQARKLSVFHLLSPKMVRSYQAIREEEVALMVERILGLCVLGPVSLSEVLGSFAKDVISRIAFSKCSREEGWNEMVDVLIEESNELLGMFHVGDYIPWLGWVSKLSGLDSMAERTFKRIDGILDTIVVSCMDRLKDDGYDGHKSFVEILLSLAKDPNQEFQFTRENIKAILEDLFGAGTDSTMIVLEWCMAELIHNPLAMKKLQSEVRRIRGTKSIVKEADLIEMKYLKAVIKETLRLHPPGPLLVPRESMSNARVQGYDIPCRARVIVNAWAISRDPEFWREPEEFQPERFIESQADFRGQHFQFIPFGGGRRICPGIGMAVTIIELALASLVCLFDWELPAGISIEEMDMLEAPGITSRKKTGIFLVAKACSDSHPIHDLR